MVPSGFPPVAFRAGSRGVPGPRPSPVRTPTAARDSVTSTDEVSGNPGRRISHARRQLPDLVDRVSCQQLPRIALGPQPPVPEQEEVARRSGHFEVMGRLDDRQPLPRHLGQHIGDELLGRRVEAGGGLVEQEQIGLLGQTLRDEDALALAPDSSPSCRWARDLMPSRLMLDSTTSWSRRVRRRHSPRCPHLPIDTASRTVSGSTSATLLRCVTYATRLSVPCSTLPAVTRITPAITPSSVDLPDPFGPTTAVVVNAGICMVS